MRRILVTGATGFIGRHTFRFLNQESDEIHAISSRKLTAADKQAYSDSIIWHEANLLDHKSVSVLVAHVRPTHLLHLAWDVTPGLYWNAPNNLQWVEASLNLLREFAEQGGQRVVMAGTCTEYDWSHGYYCVEDQTPCEPHTLYGCSKYALQLMLSKFAEKTDISAAWGRIFFLYGPWEYKSRLVPSVICSLIQDEVAQCSHGMQIRDFLHVEDVASAFVSLLRSNVTGPVNIASGIPVTLKDVIYQIADKFQHRELIHLGAIDASPDEPPLLVADTRKLNKLVEWSPQYTLEQGVDSTIRWWKQQQNL